MNANGSSTDVDIGTLPSGFHIYKVEPTGTAFNFYVDGTLQATINATFQATQRAMGAWTCVQAAPGEPGQCVAADGTTGGWVKYTP